MGIGQAGSSVYLLLGRPLEYGNGFFLGHAEGNLRRVIHEPGRYTTDEHDRRGALGARVHFWPGWGMQMQQHLANHHGTSMLSCLLMLAEIFMHLGVQILHEPSQEFVDICQIDTISARQHVIWIGCRSLPA